MRQSPQRLDAKMHIGVGALRDPSLFRVAENKRASRSSPAVIDVE
jgi:hypothetical protein